MGVITMYHTFGIISQFASKIPPFPSIPMFMHVDISTQEVITAVFHRVDDNQ